jgi:hypothetical protein
MANEITQANVAEAIAKLVAAQVLPPLENSLLMGKLVNRDFDATVQGAGDTVNIPIAPRMAATNIAETGSVTAQNPNLGNATINLSTHAEATFTIPDVTRILTAPDLVQTYAQSAVLALAEKIETDLLGTYVGFTHNTQLGATNADLTEAVIDSAETALFNAKVPALAPKYLVVDATQYGKLRQISRFSEVQTMGSGAPIVSGEIGKLKSFFVLRSQLVTRISSVSYHMAFSRDAIVLVSRRLPLPLPGMGVVAAYAEANGLGIRVLMSWNPNTLAQQFTCDVLYGYGILRATHGQTIVSQ